MFDRVRRLQSIAKYLHGRAPEYIRLARADSVVFRKELIEAIGGVAVGAAAGLLFICFLSVAIIVTSWDTQFRVLTAWLVCVGWGVLAGAGLGYARRAVFGRPVPFGDLSAALLHDLAVIEKTD
jgi:hypothetical protein